MTDNALSSLPRKLNQTFARRTGLILTGLGLAAFILGAEPGWFGLNISEAIGFVQIGVFSLGLLMNCLGGRLEYYNSYSTAQITHAMQYTYGQSDTGNYLSDIINSNLVVFFGNNPAETRMSGGGSIYDLTMLKARHSVKTIVIDPRHTDTTACFAD